MTRNLGALTTLQLCRLLEGDPLPPEDRVLARSAAPLDKLYRAQAPRLLRYFSQRSDQQDAGDLVQETFLRFAHAETDRADPLRHPEAYLSQVAANLLRNRARAAFNRTIAAQQEDLESVADPTDLTTVLEARDTLNRVQVAMSKLGPKTREIFLAHRLDGSSYAEIADRLGLSIKGVEWHMSKAIDYLHRAFGRRR